MLTLWIQGISLFPIVSPVPIKQSQAQLVCNNYLWSEPTWLGGDKERFHNSQHEKNQSPQRQVEEEEATY